MGTTEKPSPERLGKTIESSRRTYDRIWLGLTLAIVAAGGIVWLFTGNLEHLFSGLFYAVFPFMGLVYNHFFLFNPRRTPAATKARLETLADKQQRNARTVGYLNGTLLMIVSPFFFVMGIKSGAAEYGVLGAVAGSMFGVLSFVFGLQLVLWARRRK